MATTYKRNNTVKPINDSTEITYTKGLAPSGSVNLAGVVTPTYGDLLGNATPSNSSMIPGVSYSSALNPNYVDPNKVTNTNIANPSLNSFSAPVVTTPKYEQVIKPYEGETVTGESGETGGEIVDTGSTGGEIVDTGSTGGESGNGTPTSTLPLSYEEYILSMKSNADDAYKKSILDAETARDKAVKDARNAYDTSLSGYGANAEALRKMGLVGSGYSDYLDASAYAQMRDDVLAAHNTEQQAISNAEALKTQQYAQYDGLYADYLLEQDRIDKAKLAEEESNRLKAFDNIYNNISDYSIADIDRLAAQYGLTEQQKTDLKARRTQEVLATLASGKYDKAFLDTLQKIGDLDEKSYREWIAKLYGEDPETVKNMDATAYNTWLNGKIEEKIAEDEVMQNIDTGVTAFLNEEGTGYISPTVAREKMGEMSLTPEQKAALDASYAQLYTPTVSSNVKFLKDNDFSGGRITLSDPNGITKYKVRVGDEITDPLVTSLTIDNGSVFTFRNEVYVKYNSKIYKVESRANESGYTALLNALKTEAGSQTTESQTNSGG